MFACFFEGEGGGGVIVEQDMSTLYAPLHSILSSSGWKACVCHQREESHQLWYYHEIIIQSYSFPKLKMWATNVAFLEGHNGEKGSKK